MTKMLASDEIREQLTVTNQYSPLPNEAVSNSHLYSRPTRSIAKIREAGEESAVEYLLASRLRLIQPGDLLIYGLSGTWEDSSGKYRLKGSMQYEAADIVFGGQAMIRIDQKTRFSTDDQQFSFQNGSVVHQDDATSDLFLYADSDEISLYTLIRPVLRMPGDWNAGRTYEYEIRYAGETEPAARESFHIIKEETITVPAGRFETWRVSRSSIHPSGNTQGTYWYAPQMGNFVAAEFIDTDSHARQVLHIKAKLRDYHLANKEAATEATPSAACG